MRLFCTQDHSHTIQRLHLEPGDVLVVKVDQRLTREMANEIKIAFTDKLAQPCEVIVIPNEISLSVISPHHREIAT